MTGKTATPGKGVLVLRPADASATTAKAVRALGHAPVLLPVTAIRDSGAAIAAGEFDAVALTSAAAVRIVASRYADGQPPAWLRQPAFCVGAATAAAARRAGWRHAVSASGDGAALARLIAAKFAGRAARILYLCGHDRAFDLAAALAGRGIAVTEAAIYAAELLQLDCGAVTTAIAQSDVVLLHSARSARHFFAESARCRADLSGLTLLAFSETVADTVPAACRQSVHVAGQPNEAALLALLGPAGGTNPDLDR